MAQSTTTLLEVANAVLLNVNERQVSTLVNNQGQQLKNAISATLRKISNESNWPWLEDIITGTWTGNLVTLPTTVASIKGVYWTGTSARALLVGWLSRELFSRYQLTSYASGGRPLWWTMEDYNSFRVNPYPTVGSEQDKVTAFVYSNLALPSTDSSVFSIPEHFIDVLILGATALYAARHMEDDKLYQLFMTEYQMGMNIMRSRHYSTPGKNMNLYGGPRYGRDQYWG